MFKLPVSFLSSIPNQTLLSSLLFVPQHTLLSLIRDALALNRWRPTAGSVDLSSASQGGGDTFGASRIYYSTSKNDQ